ncbi:hypothetical protein Tco_1289399 [Tanacetum coccineum]
MKKAVDQKAVKEASKKELAEKPAKKKRREGKKESAANKKEASEKLKEEKLTAAKVKEAELPEMLNDERDEGKDYANFEKIINNHMNAAESKKKMKDVNFSFFTTITQGDYYVILFNLLKANAIILDNESDVDYSAKYTDVFELVASNV